MQTSSKKLDQDQKEHVLEQFVTLLCDIDHPQEMKEFLQLFLSKTEISVLSKRLATIVLLDQGKSYEEIIKLLHISSATISSVSDTADAPQMQSVIQKIKRSESIKKFFDALIG